MDFSTTDFIKFGILITVSMLVALYVNDHLQEQRVRKIMAEQNAANNGLDTNQ